MEQKIYLVHKKEQGGKKIHLVHEKTIRVVKTFKIVKRSCSLSRYYRVEDKYATLVYGQKLDILDTVQQGRVLTAKNLS